MGYEISVHKLPEDIEIENISEDDLFGLVYKNDTELVCINFSLGNHDALAFAEVFDIILTNDYYFRIFTSEDYDNAVKKLRRLNMNSELIDKVKSFLGDIKGSIDGKDSVFFYCR